MSAVANSCTGSSNYFYPSPALRSTRPSFPQRNPAITMSVSQFDCSTHALYGWQPVLTALTTTSSSSRTRTSATLPRARTGEVSPGDPNPHRRHTGIHRHTDTHSTASCPIGSLWAPRSANNFPVQFAATTRLLRRTSSSMRSPRAPNPRRPSSAAARSPSLS